MDYHLIVFLFVFLLLGELENVNGFANYRWIKLKSGDYLPRHTINVRPGRYVGRARHFDEILPAEVTDDGLAYVKPCSKVIQKPKFEILTTSGGCEWMRFDFDEGVEETALRVGTAWNGEPLFIATTYENVLDKDDSTTQFNTIFFNLSHNEPDWLFRSDKWQYLTCNTQTLWVDTTVFLLPDNTIPSDNDDPKKPHVARLKQSCEVVTGEVDPTDNSAHALLRDGTSISAYYCQVLVGEPFEYYWERCAIAKIPDYAVVNGKYQNELEYVAKFNNTIGHLTFKEILNQNIRDYEILVVNVSQSFKCSSKYVCM